jgi:protein DGCR14
MGYHEFSPGCGQFQVFNLDSTINVMDSQALTTTPKEPFNPTQQRSHNNQTVLEEDEYTAALSQIIARDFFPSLVGTEYLESQKPPQGLSDTPTQQTPLQLGDTPFMRPGDTPYFPIHDDEGPARKKRKLEKKDGGVNTDLSLDDFQAQYTSEDNASFTSILKDENIQRKERYKWAYDAERRVIGWKEKETRSREIMLLTGGEAGGHGPTGVRGRLLIERPEDGEDRKLIEASKPHDEEAQAVEAAEDAGKALVVLAKLPELTESEDNQVSKDPRGVMAPTKDTRSATIPGWKFKVSARIHYTSRTI